MTKLHEDAASTEDPVVPVPARSPSPRWLVATTGFIARHALAVTVGGLLLFLIGGPLLFLLRMSTSTPGSRPSSPTGFTLQNYEQVLTSPATWEASRNTAVYAIGVTIVSISLAALAAWLVERTDLPYRNAAWVIMLAPLAIPKMLSSMAYILLLSPRAGLLNVGIRDVLDVVGIHLTEGPFNIYSMWGMIYVEGLRGATALFLMIVGAFRLMDPALEEASIMSGAGRLGTLRHVTLPLMTPVLVGAVIYGFVGNLQDFDTPLFLGLPAGIFVLPTLIYFTAYSSPTPNWGTASAYANLFLVGMVVLSTVYYRVVIRKSNRFATVSGKGFRPARLKLGRWRKWAVAGFGGFAFLVMGLPLLTLIWTSLLPVYEPPSFEALGKLTLDNYMHFTTANAFAAFRNSVGLSVVAAITTIGFAFVVSWAVIRVKVRGRAVMDSMAFVPNVIPSVALGLAFVVFFLSPGARWLGLYGSLGVLVIAFTVHYLAYASRITNGALLQMNTELDEAGWVSGVGKIRTLFGVTLPVLFSTFVAAAIWVFAMTFKNLSLPLLLSTPGTRTISMEIYSLWTVNGQRETASALGVTMVAILVVTAYLARRVVAKGFTAD
ncbi:MAG TPA: iron ABC transporter permease [Acidimicrobiia bacterium]